MYKQLINDIKEFLKENEDCIDFDESFPCPIKEGDIPQYMLDGLKLFIDGEETKITPVGTLIVGAYGRVDIEQRSYVAGNKSRKYFLLNKDDDENFTWRIYIKDGVDSEFTDFNEENFFKLLNTLLPEVYERA